MHNGNAVSLPEFDGFLYSEARASELRLCHGLPQARGARAAGCQSERRVLYERYSDRERVDLRRSVRPGRVLQGDMTPGL